MISDLVCVLSTWSAAFQSHSIAAPEPYTHRVNQIRPESYTAIARHFRPEIYRQVPGLQTAEDVYAAGGRKLIATMS